MTGWYGVAAPEAEPADACGRSGADFGSCWRHEHDQDRLPKSPRQSPGRRHLRATVDTIRKSSSRCQPAEMKTSDQAALTDMPSRNAGRINAASTWSAWRLRPAFFASGASAGSRSPKGLTACPESFGLDVQAIPWDSLDWTHRNRVGVSPSAQGLCPDSSSYRSQRRRPGRGRFGAARSR